MAVLHDPIPQPLVNAPLIAKKRSLRRHHVERLKHTRYWRFRAVWTPSHIEALRARLDDVWGPRCCSCGICRMREPERRTREKRRWRTFEHQENR